MAMARMAMRMANAMANGSWHGMADGIWQHNKQMNHSYEFKFYAT